MTIRARVENCLYVGGYRLAIYDETQDGRAFLQRMQFEYFERHKAVPDDKAWALEDTCLEDHVRPFLQAMADAAWDLGIRPKQMQAQTDELTAVRYHLEDMRKLVFDLSFSLNTVEAPKS